MRALLRELGRIRVRLLVVNLVVVLVPVAGLEFADVYERQLLASLERDMRNQAVLVRRTLEDGLEHERPLEYRRWETMLRAAATDTRTRIRVLDERGVVVVDSHRHGPPEGPEPPPPSFVPGSVRRRVPRMLADAGVLDEWAAADAGVPLDAEPGADGGVSLDPTARPIDRRALGSSYSFPSRSRVTWPAVSDRREVRDALAGRRSAYTRVRDAEPAVLLFLTEPVRRTGHVVGVVYVVRSTRPVLVELYRIRTGLMVVLAAAMVFTAFVTLVLAWSISRPLARLARAAKRIAAGERNVSVPVEGGGEISALGEAFATMTQELDARVRYIEAFAADVAHEFKSPLTSIRGAAELLEEGAADDPAARARFLRNIALDVERLDRLVSRLLELSRIEASRESKERVDLRTLTSRAAERASTPDQPIEIRFVGTGDGPLRIRARPMDLETALLNLLDNAARFSPPGAPITLTITASRTGISLAVRDRGPGIPPANRERIFDRFFTTDADQDGTGLGLAIVQSVASAHGGHVTVDNPAGGGAELTIHLPWR